MKKKRMPWIIGRRKILPCVLMVKFILVFMLIFPMGTHAGSCAQSTVTLDLKEATLKAVIQEIRRLTDYSFVYSDEDIQTVKPKTFQMRGVSPMEVLDFFLEGSNLHYQVVDKTIIIKKINQPQERKVIAGKVVDEGNKPLVGVTVVIKGTAIGVATDNSGNFTMDVSAVNEKSVRLIFSFIGYETQEVVSESGKELVVRMFEEDTELDEVVITALGIKRDQRALGYATSTISGEDMVAAGVPVNPLTALYGKAAGVGIQATSAGPLGGVQIRIRGAQGLESSTNLRPLFVVDGVPIYDTESSMASRGYDPLNSFDYGSGINDVNAEDIESIEILKGAKASVLYGSQGANGVVLISTKSGARTRGFGVSISYAHEVEVPYNPIDFQNEYGSGEHEYHYSWEDDEETIRRTVSSRYSFGPKFDATQTVKFFDGSTRPYQAYKDNYMALFYGYIPMKYLEVAKMLPIFVVLREIGKELSAAVL